MVWLIPYCLHQPWFKNERSVKTSIHSPHITKQLSDEVCDYSWWTGTCVPWRKVVGGDQTGFLSEFSEIQCHPFLTRPESKRAPLVEQEFGSMSVQLRCWDVIMSTWRRISKHVQHLEPSELDESKGSVEPNQVVLNNSWRSDQIWSSADHHVFDNSI